MEMIKVDLQCPFCGEAHSVEVPLEGYGDWIMGELIQNALPNVSPTEREQLQSHMCPDCQKRIFGEDE